MYHGNCCEKLSQQNIAASEKPNWLLELMLEIFNSRDFSKFRTAAEDFFKKLWGGVEKGYGQNFENTSYDGEDFNMLAALQRNVVQFSNAKDYTMQREMLSNLIDDKGKLRSWNDFKILASRIGENHNNAWLRAEYNLSVASAQMAAKWNNIIKNKELFPLLQYDAILDNNTTKTCKNFDRIILPVEHWFWTQYYPPNHFGCRSTVRQMATGQETNLGNIDFPNIPKLFQTNLAQNGLLYPKDHPYFNGYDGNRDKALMQKEVKKNAIEKYEGMSVDVDGLGSIKITKSGIKKGVSTYGKNNEAFKEIALNNVLPNLLEKSKYIPHLDRVDGQENYYYLSIPNMPNINITIKETRSGGKVYYGFSLKK